jgi:hypothetical protein
VEANSIITCLLILLAINHSFGAKRVFMVSNITSKLRMDIRSYSHNKIDEVNGCCLVQFSCHKGGVEISWESTILEPQSGKGNPLTAEIPV